MVETYSTYEAKAKFSEILRKVRAEQSVVIAYRGKEIAEIRPITSRVSPIEKSLNRFEERGLLSGHRIPPPLAKRPGMNL